jgi:hypothetical protein
MDDLTQMSPAEARHLRELGEAWKSYAPAMRAKLALDGGMTWKRVNGADYLCRYRPDPDTGKKKFTSLGRRSRETEATYKDFISRRDAARQTVLAGRDDIALAGRIAKAHGLARLPAKQADILRAFWRGGLDEHLTLFGGTALFAYEMPTEILMPIELARDDHLIFLFDGSPDCTIEDIGEAYEDATGAKATVVRLKSRRSRHDRLIIESKDVSGIEILPCKFLLDQVDDDDQADVLLGALQMSTVRGLTVARDAQPVEITAPDPRAYAITACVLGRNDEIWAERAEFAATLVRERWPEQFDPRQQAVFPELYGGPTDGELGYRGP